MLKLASKQAPSGSLLICYGRSSQVPLCTNTCGRGGGGLRELLILDDGKNACTLERCINGGLHRFPSALVYFLMGYSHFHQDRTSPSPSPINGWLLLWEPFWGHC